MLSALSDAGAEYLIIGATALAAHGYTRGTKDIDIWIRPTPENAARVYRALIEFGAPMHEVSVQDLSTPGLIYQIGVDPGRIYFLTQPAGVTFEPAWQQRGNRTRSSAVRISLHQNGRPAARTICATSKNSSACLSNPPTTAPLVPPAPHSRETPPRATASTARAYPMRRESGSARRGIRTLPPE